MRVVKGAPREVLRRPTNDDRLVEGLKADYTTLELSQRHRAMLDLAAKLTTRPWGAGQGDVDTLGGVGFTDSDVLHIALVTAYFNYMNRVTGQVGVHP
ncbi:MAG: peroxidase [Dehalococcoidia bacterium]